MKYLDKLLKILKTDRNTFFTYIFTILTAYIVIDRFVELLSDKEKIMRGE